MLFMVTTEREYRGDRIMRSNTAIQIHGERIVQSSHLNAISSISWQSELTFDGYGLFRKWGDMSNHWDSSEKDQSSPGSIDDMSFTVLVIDDHAGTLDVFHECLVGAGHTVLKAQSGREGLGLFEDNHVDIVLCDLGMPEMNGWEVGKAILEICTERGVDKPPFLLVTAWADQIAAHARIGKKGIDKVLGKPIAMLDLLQAVEDEISKRRREPSEV
jgi:CheY-like chemotaxis protein